LLGASLNIDSFKIIIKKNHSKFRIEKTVAAQNYEFGCTNFLVAQLVLILARIRSNLVNHRHSQQNALQTVKRK
jgi:hypothetical protein